MAVCYQLEAQIITTQTDSRRLLVAVPAVALNPAWLCTGILARLWIDRYASAHDATSEDHC